jgi:ATP diphosphatase
VSEPDKEQKSILDDISSSEGVIQQALDIQDRAAQHGFDWPDIAPVFDKIEEELDELKQEVLKAKSLMAGDFSNDEIKAEYGDLLFSCLNLSRFLRVLPSEALQVTNDKFIRRFQFIEKRLFEQDSSISGESLSRLDQLWELAKTYEKD